MEIRSLHMQDKPFSLDELFKIKGAVRKIVVISAYIDIESIKQLIDFLSNFADSRGKAVLKIFIDKSSSRFFSDRKARKELLKKQKEIQNLFSESSGIFLVQFGKLFHSKVYLIEGNRNGKIMMGSMNLTQKGINDNEEIMMIDNYSINGRAISNRLSNWVKEYAKILISKSTPVFKNANGNYPSCLRHLFLNGSIYYEFTEQSPFRFKLNLPKNIIKQQADIDQLLESSVNDTISIEKIITSSTYGLGISLPKLENSRAVWKKYCVKTCYGFWNPDLWNEDLSSTLETRIKKRKPYYDKLTEIIKEDGSELKLKFIQLCQRIQVFLNDIKISDWEYAESEKAKEAWDKWFEKLISKLNNEELYNRLILGIFAVPTPDIWNDPLSSTEFENSFFESILYHWSKEYSKETTNIIAQAIARNLDISVTEKDEMDFNQLKVAMENWLIENSSHSIVAFNEE
jgi:HKD family nuclease